MPKSSPSPAALAGRFVCAVSIAALGALLAAAPQPQTSAAVPQGPPATQKPASDAPQQPAFRTEANFVRVDVYPTVDGRAVQDLKQADFDVQEDGKPQEISTFEHVLIQAGGPQETRSD